MQPSGARACDQHQLPAGQGPVNRVGRSSCAGTWRCRTSCGRCSSTRTTTAWSPGRKCRTRAPTTSNPPCCAEIAVSRGGANCPLRVKDLALAESCRPELSVGGAHRPTARKAGMLAVGGTLFMSGDASQRVLLSAVAASEQLTGVFGADSPVWIEPERAFGLVQFRAIRARGRMACGRRLRPHRLRAAAAVALGAALR